MIIRRLTRKPIITVQSHPQAGDNINGPSLIRVPDWVPEPLGQYYLYFGHHNGRFIRLAYADSLAGPWVIHPPGVLPLAASGFNGHIASPDVHVDHQSQRILMYFHGSDRETDATSPQFTRLATSADGIDFRVISENLGGAYWRVFQLKRFFYSLEMPGRFKRSCNETGPFTTGPQIFNPRMRHSAVALRDNTLEVYYSKIGDCPECILCTSIDVGEDWTKWTVGPETAVATPTGRLEGADRGMLPSTVGIAVNPVNQLRDPAIFEENTHRYLLFSVAGEQGIAIAEIE